MVVGFNVQSMFGTSSLIGKDASNDHIVAGLFHVSSATSNPVVIYTFRCFVGDGLAVFEGQEFHKRKWKRQAPGQVFGNFERPKVLVGSHKYKRVEWLSAGILPPATLSISFIRIWFETRCVKPCVVSVLVQRSSKFLFEGLEIRIEFSRRQSPRQTLKTARHQKCLSNSSRCERDAVMCVFSLTLCPLEHWTPNGRVDWKMCFSREAVCVVCVVYMNHCDSQVERFVNGTSCWM